MARRAFPGAVAEEIVQDVLMQVWIHREQYDPDRGTLTAWVLRIVRNRITDVVRAQRARPRLEPWQPAMTAEPAGGSPVPTGARMLFGNLR